jgi:hypothetical protein
MQMKKLLALATLFTLGLAGNVFADGMRNVVGPTTEGAARITVSAYNDSGSDLTSGTVVIWDNDDTEFDRTGYPYITTVAGADSDWIAGVTLDPTCISGTMCEVVIYGWAWTRIADSTDGVAEDTTVSTSSVAGLAGDWGASANTCYLGILTEAYDRYTGTDIGTDTAVYPVFVNPGCED